MAVQSLTYAELATIWGVSKDAARKKVEGLRLPRKLGNDGKTRVTIDLEEVRHVPKSVKPEGISPPGGNPPPGPGGDQEETRGSPPEVQFLQGMVEILTRNLEREREQLEQERREHRAEKERADSLSVQLISATRELAEARVEVAKSQSEKGRAEDAIADRNAWRALAQRPWWRRLAG